MRPKKRRRKKVTPAQFRRRIEKVYRAAFDFDEAKKRPGRNPLAPAWFASRTGYGRSTVYRWLNGTHPIPRIAIVDLEALEAETNGRNEE